MQIQLIEQYSADEIAQARDEIVQLQGNLKKIEELYQQLHLTLNNQQDEIEQMTNAINQTETSLGKGVFDLQKISQLRTDREKSHCLIIIFIGTIAGFFLLIVISVLINVIQTFSYKRVIR